MIESLISEIFKRIGKTWMLDSGFIEPDEDDVRKVLDEAAKHLYDGDIGDRLETGGLIIEKRDRQRKDVYVYLGTYE